MLLGESPGEKEKPRYFHLSFGLNTKNDECNWKTISIEGNDIKVHRIILISVQPLYFVSFAYVFTACMQTPKHIWPNALRRFTFAPSAVFLCKKLCIKIFGVQNATKRKATNAKMIIQFVWHLHSIRMRGNKKKNNTRNTHLSRSNYISISLVWLCVYGATQLCRRPNEYCSIALSSPLPIIPMRMQLFSTPDFVRKTKQPIRCICLSGVSDYPFEKAG